MVVRHQNRKCAEYIVLDVHCLNPNASIGNRNFVNAMQEFALDVRFYLAPNSTLNSTAPSLTEKESKPKANCSRQESVADLRRSRNPNHSEERKLLRNLIRLNRLNKSVSQVFVNLSVSYLQLPCLNKFSYFHCNLRDLIAFVVAQFPLAHFRQKSIHITLHLMSYRNDKNHISVRHAMPMLYTLHTAHGLHTINNQFSS